MRDVVLAASHGTSSPEGRAAVRRLVEAVAAALPVEVVGCHVDVEQPDVPSALGAAARSGEADRAVIVPLLLSAGYHVYVDLAQAAEASPLPTVVTAALGPDPRLVDALADRLREAGHRPTDLVVLAAAGSSDARAVADCSRTADLLGARLDSAVSIGFISSADPALPSAVKEARRLAAGARVVVASYLLAPGFFASLARKSGADLVTAPLLTADSTPAGIVELVVERASLDRSLVDAASIHGA
ncbi:sirohydrochlorin chelatase [Leifsonia shinshuensis]|uniref:Cobalamin biosynthesis protein CbiX n=1 Tax=Leifsonia shinshuensis TaxID=150026 RepID=A0A7G6YE29_9MICO|nr:CbiX/SirB N-terminal domain-containing protein [Leifsonia shinshuensis]QNE36744.1 cobalamin biosynthesis protein CbiX [Leifsonia shinshuensis]